MVLHMTKLRLQLLAEPCWLSYCFGCDYVPMDMSNCAVPSAKLAACTWFNFLPFPSQANAIGLYLIVRLWHLDGLYSSLRADPGRMDECPLLEVIGALLRTSLSKHGPMVGVDEIFSGSGTSFTSDRFSITFPPVFSLDHSACLRRVPP